MTRPEEKQDAATTPAARGPTTSSHLPVAKVQAPRHAALTENTGTTSARAQSAEQEATTPSSRVSGPLKMDQAYTLGSQSESDSRRPAARTEQGGDGRCAHEPPQMFVARAGSAER